MYKNGDTLKIVSVDSWCGWAKKLLGFKFILKFRNDDMIDISMNKKELKIFKIDYCPRIMIINRTPTPELIKNFSYCRMLLVEKNMFID